MYIQRIKDMFISIYGWHWEWKSCLCTMLSEIQQDNILYNIYAMNKCVCVYVYFSIHMDKSQNQNTQCWDIRGIHSGGRIYNDVSINVIQLIKKSHKKGLLIVAHNDQIQTASKVIQVSVDCIMWTGTAGNRSSSTFHDADLPKCAQSAFKMEKRAFQIFVNSILSFFIDTSKHIIDESLFPLYTDFTFIRHCFQYTQTSSLEISYNMAQCSSDFPTGNHQNVYY